MSRAVRPKWACGKDGGAIETVGDDDWEEFGESLTERAQKRRGGEGGPGHDDCGPAEEIEASDEGDVENGVKMKEASDEEDVENGVKMKSGEEDVEHGVKMKSGVDVEKGVKMKKANDEEGIEASDEGDVENVENGVKKAIVEGLQQGKCWTCSWMCATKIWR